MKPYVISISREYGSGGRLIGKQLAQQLGTIRVASIILLGALVKKLGLEQYDWTALIRRKVPAKFLEANLKAYQVGLQSV